MTEYCSLGKARGEMAADTDESQGECVEATTGIQPGEQLRLYLKISPVTDLGQVCLSIVIPFKLGYRLPRNHIVEYR